jgi:HSP20 family protein
MANIGEIHLQRLSGRLGEIAYAVTRVQLTQFPQTNWRPAINAYRCENGMLVCVDLAGVDRHEIHLQVEPRRLCIRGVRVVPEPDRTLHKAIQVLEMEIDAGQFEREILFPMEVEPGGATARQQNGLLWIDLPARSPA